MKYIKNWPKIVKNWLTIKMKWVTNENKDEIHLKPSENKDEMG